MHGAGSPQAQRVQIGRAAQLELRKRLAQNLAGIGPAEDEPSEKTPGGYMERVFKPEKN
jgi:4-hydroxybutyryl-CoA dehydratase/vinylacetyl-CoA-Delta-isomerase